MGQSLEAFLQWKSLVSLLFACTKAVSIDLAASFHFIYEIVIVRSLSCCCDLQFASELDLARYLGLLCCGVCMTNVVLLMIYK